MIYMKLNNHDQKELGYVAYYDNPNSQSPYRSQLGGPLIVSAKGRSGKNPDQMRDNFQALVSGDMILIFQTFISSGRSQSRIITHLLQVTGNPIRDGLFNTPWSYGNNYRHSVETVVIARLNPLQFSGIYQNDNVSISIQSLPEEFVSMLQLGFQKTPQDGNVYTQFDGLEVNQEAAIELLQSCDGYEFNHNE